MITMMKHPFLLCAAAGLMIAGGVASATTLTVYNEDDYGESYNTPIFDASGHSLQNGSAMLGHLASSTWSFDLVNGKIEWSNNNTPVDQLSYSQMAEIRQSFTTSLSAVSPEYPSTITNNGQFSLSGTLASGLEGKPIVLLITNDDSPGEFSLFTFRNVETGELAKYPGAVGDDMMFFFGSQEEAIAQGYDWYVTPLFNDDFHLVPEPATATLGLLGLAALMMRRRR